MKGKGFLSRRAADTLSSNEPIPSELPNRMFAGTGLQVDPSPEELDTTTTGVGNFEPATPALSTDLTSSAQGGDGDQENLQPTIRANKRSLKRQSTGHRSITSNGTAKDRRYTLTVRLDKSLADKFDHILKSTDSGASKYVRRAMVSDFKRHLMSADVRKRNHNIVTPATVRMDIRLPTHFSDRIISATRVNFFEPDATVLARYFAPLLEEYIKNMNPVV